MESFPTTSGHGHSKFFLQTDIALSESKCSGTSIAARAVPPPNSPGAFYPYWSIVETSHGVCAIEFGNAASGPGVNNLGKDPGYGSDQIFQQGYPEFEGPNLAATC